MSSIDEVLPDISFRDFPISVSDPNISFDVKDSNVIIKWENQNKIAIIPLDVWEELVEYAVDNNTAKKKYEALQKAYGKKAKLSN